jgi:hypothetical protein
VWGVANVGPIPDGNAITFTSIVSGGGGVGGSGSGVSSFLLQPGIYQVQFFATNVFGCTALVQVGLGSSQVVAQWFPLPGPLSSCDPTKPSNSGNIVEVLFLQVSSPNQLLGFFCFSITAGTNCLDFSGKGANFSQGATLILTQLQ